MTPLFTVGIPVHNRVHHVRDAVESVLAQTDPDFELVVVDNASTDGTWEYLQGLAARGGGDLRVQVFRNSVNLGMVPNWRRCIEEARGTWFKFLMSDDLLFPWALATIRGTLERFPDCRVVSAAGTDFKGPLPRPAPPPAGRLPAERVYTREEVRAIARRGEYLPANNPDSYTLETATAKRLVLTPEYRLVEDRLGATGHDVDYFLLTWCALRSPRLVYLPEPLYGVRYHEQNAAKRYFYDLLYRLRGDLLVRRLLLPGTPRSRRVEVRWAVRMLGGIGLDYAKSLVLGRPTPAPLSRVLVAFTTALAAIWRGEDLPGV